MMYARSTIILSFDEPDQPAIIVGSLASKPGLMFFQSPDEEARAGKPLKPMTEEERRELIRSHDWVMMEFNSAASIDRQVETLLDIKRRFFDEAKG